MEWKRIEERERERAKVLNKFPHFIVHLCVVANKPRMREERVHK
jgi:hypothetical protein